ncbi:D-glucuronyl C5-epimerase family protein [Candidatus Neomarinimicrobiota bacterium]
MPTTIRKIPLLWLLAFLACDEHPADDSPPDLERMDFSIIEIPREERIWSGQPRITLEIYFPADSQGIIIFQYHDSTYYHPMQLAHRQLWYMDSYYLTGEEEYLHRSELYAAKMLEYSMVTEQARYFYHSHDFFLHEIETDVMIAPWCSGMAQGDALSVFVRLYEATEKAEYLELAHQTFRSFTRFKGKSLPWTVRMDNDGYYWIEEYPFKGGTRVLNGFVYGLSGLYDYYILTGDNAAKELLQAALTTLYHYLPEYRVEGGASYYCLYHKLQSKVYHIRDHLPQLEYLFQITGDPHFETMYDLFYADYHEGN